MSELSYQQLASACGPGGATAMSIVTHLAPAGGPHVAIAPQPDDETSQHFLYETRIIDHQPTLVVIIDSKTQQLHRVEQAIQHAICDGDPLLSRVPRIQVSYPGNSPIYTDLELPQRVYDERIRTGTINGHSVLDDPDYQQLLHCSPDNARALLDTSPTSLVFGAHDSSNCEQDRYYQTIFTGEIIGIPLDTYELSPIDQQNNLLNHHNVTESSNLANHLETIKDNSSLVDNSDALVTAFDKNSIHLHHGDTLACKDIIRTQIISFSLLRCLRFDCGPAGDIACRVLLACYVLAGIVRANRELGLRAYCDLVETEKTLVHFSMPDHDDTVIEYPTPDEVDTLLEQALHHAFKEADICWQGRISHISGSPLVPHPTTNVPVNKQLGFFARLGHLFT